MNEPSESATAARSRMWRVVIAIAVVAIGVIAVLAVLGRMVRRDAEHRVACEQNLQHIGMMLQIYANDNRGWWPPNMEALVKATDMKLDTFICPAGIETPGTTAADADNPAHNSYVYVPTQSIQLMPMSVPCFMHDKPGIHRDGGLHFLFADGHAEYYSRNDADRILADLAAKNLPAYPMHVPRR